MDIFISNLVDTTHFYTTRITHHQLRPLSKDWKTNNLKIFGNKWTKRPDKRDNQNCKNQQKVTYTWNRLTLVLINFIMEEL